MIPPTGVYRFTSIARPVDPAYPTNRALLFLVPIAAAAAATGRALDRRGRHWFGSETSDGRRQHGVFARAWPIGTTALWIAVLLTAYVFFYYLD